MAYLADVDLGVIKKHIPRIEMADIEDLCSKPWNPEGKPELQDKFVHDFKDSDSP